MSLADPLFIVPLSRPNFGKHLCKSGKFKSIYFLTAVVLFTGAAKTNNYDTISNYRHTKVIYWYGCTQKKLDSSY
jgi:hypothetical protein